MHGIFTPRTLNLRTAGLAAQSHQLTPRSPIAFSVLIFVIGLLAGCGGNGGGGGTTAPPPPNPDFSISVQPNPLVLPVGGTAQFQVSVTGTGGFSGTVSITGSGIPTGVTESPTTFSIGPGQSQNVTLTTPSTETAQSATVTWAGTSGSLSHNASANLKVETAPTISSPTRTTFIRNDSTPIEVFKNTGGYSSSLPLARYNPNNKYFFVSNTLLNRVEVYSAQSEQLVATIFVPAPVGLDFTVAYDLLYVGTLTDYLYVIDPVKLQVVQRVVPLAGYSASLPIVLSDGRVLIITDLNGVDGSAVQLMWTPSSQSGQNVSSMFNENIVVAARSGDHSKVLLLPASVGNALLFDVSSSTVLSVPPSFGFWTAVGNQDGSSWYVEGIDGTLTLLNAQLQPVVVSTTACCSSDIILSPDQQTVYTSAYTNSFADYDSSAFDATTLAYKGWISSVPVEGFINAAELKDMDETGLILGLEDHGVAFLDSSLPLNTSPRNTGFNFGYITPDNAALNTTESVKMTILGGANSDLSTPTVYFGPNAATNVSLNNPNLTVTSPASPFAGPVNVFTSQSSGNLSIVPDGFSYGPTLVYEPTNAATADGGGPADFFTFGAGTSASNIQLGFGATSATVNAINPGYAFIPYPFLNLQDLEVTVPPGSAGSVALSVQAPSGSTTSPTGFRYYPALQTFPLTSPSLQQGTYDGTRGRLYVTNGDHLEVLDIASQAWTTPITFSAAILTRSLQSVSISPDGTILAAGDLANKTILVLNPDQPTNVTEYPTNNTLGATTLIAINGAVYYWGCGPSGYSPLKKLYVSNGSGAGLGPSCAEPHDRLAATADGSQVFAYTGGALYTIVTSTDQETLRLSLVAIADTGDMAVNADGTRSTSAGAILDENDYFAGVISYLDAATVNVTARYGLKLHPTGSYIFQPLGQQVDVIDGNTGTLRDRVSLPVTVADAFDASVVDPNDNALFLLTTQGVSELSLNSLPIGIGSVTPSSGLTTGGTTVTLTGDGFDSATQIQVDGASVPSNFVSSQSITFVTPGHPAGGVEVSVQNSTGQTYVLQDAFTFTSSAAKSKSGRRETPPSTSNHQRRLTIGPGRSRISHTLLPPIR